jgi:bifunctional non-homologous end joining protein LigD
MRSSGMACESLAFLEGGVQLRSRNGNDVTAAYPELRGLAGRVGSAATVADGEVTVVGEDGRTDFGLLQSQDA